MKLLFRTRSLLLAFCALLCGAVSVSAMVPAYRSVAEFGADGSDDRDDTVAIQAAIDAVSEKGGVVFLPAGKYLLHAPLMIRRASVTLLGEGRGGTNDRMPTGSLLVLKTGTSNTAIELRDCSHSGVRSLGIFRQSGPVESNQATDAAIRLVGTYHCFVREVTLASVVSGIEILNGISPVVEDISIKNPSGAFGIWLHGAGMVNGRRQKVDAAHFVRISGGAGKGVPIEWMVFGPNVDGAKIQDGRFVAGSRGLVLRGGNPEAGDTRPKYVYTDKFGCDHVSNEGVLIEAGNDLFMTNTWIGQNRNATGMVIGPGFTGGALLTDLRIRGAGGHGLHVQGGRNVYIVNPLIGANGTNRTLVPRGSTEAAGILIEAGVKNLRVTGGGVCPLYESGPTSLQNYGVRYLGDEKQVLADSVRISGVDTSGNPVPFAPANLTVDRAP